jgi:type IV secretion system protein VirB9
MSLEQAFGRALWRLMAAPLLIGAGILVAPCAARAQAALPDARIRTLAYAADEVYRLRGYAGYQIDLEFESGESFVGLGTGDLDGLTFAAQDNHLFLKPRAGGIDTNLTVLTTRRAYHFDYSASARRPDPVLGDVVYVLRFSYPAPASARAADTLEQGLARAAGTRWHNLDYRFRGSAQLKPLAAWDDGVQTHLRFAPQQELPAIFVRNDDDSESLLNFSVEAGEVVVHRVARQFVLRRGHLQGCVLNSGFTGSGERLESGTVSPGVERVTRGARP